MYYIKKSNLFAIDLVQVLPKGRFGEMISFELHFEKWHEKTQKPLWFLGFLNRYLFRFALLVAERGLEPLTSGLSLRATLRFPKKSSGFRFSSIFSTAAALGHRLSLPPAAAASDAQRAPLVSLITRNAKAQNFSPKQKQQPPNGRLLFFWLRREDLNL